MPRRKGMEWAPIRDALLSETEKIRTVEEREFVPDMACGKCKNFFQGALGMCHLLKEGSDISSETPVFKTEGEACLVVSFNTDASKCSYYNEMEMIDTDISQSLDPMVSRHQRQMTK